MDWKTTTGGTTTLVLDPDEEAWLRGVARARKQHYEQALFDFEALRRNNPHIAEFGQLAEMFMPSKVERAFADAFAQTTNGLDDLVDLDAHIRKEIRECSSLQVRALLLQARATTLQAIALIETLRGLDD